ncbi:hypothetical protein [Legionella feeleii]|uniref:Uncharacterized protein n=1 Tax=Legionella feeleii TaxID=453 RepID=A0A0W0U1X3_9GAMM|nr:hypothetical protein [Legionella feeleii]KTD02020.1 hypothetical protein Lfee_0865 [Legionella feeleii]SPX59897.1 Uncharacterised protein [Legionella feeleii]
MIIYLDNCHLQKVVQNPNLILSEKLQTKEVTLIFSSCNFIELTQRTDTKAIQMTASFLKNCEIKYLRSFDQILKRDVSILLSGKTNLDWFSNNYSDCIFLGVNPNELEIDLDLFQFFKLNPIDKIIELSLEDRSAFESLNDFEIKNLNQWVDDNKTYCRVNKNKYLNDVEKLRINKLIENLLPTNCINADNIKLIENSHKQDFLSFSFMLYRQHIRHYDTNKKWSVNDLFDINQCAAIPFCDIFATDSDNASEAEKTKQLFNSENQDLITCQIVNTIEKLEYVNFTK